MRPSSLPSSLHKLLRFGLLLMPLLVLAILLPAQAQGSVFRIGVLDDEFGPISRGARLAVQEINASGGVRGADGTRFRLELVIQPADDVAFSISNLQQASVIAVLGPESSNDVLSNLATLQGIGPGIPILTPATDDTILALDTSDQLFRLRAQEALQGRALARFIANDLNANIVVTAQLDLASTAGIVGFTTAASQQGIPVRQSFLRDQNTSIDTLASRIISANAQVAVTYGPPALAADLYLSLRESGWSGTFAYNNANSVEFREAVPRELLEGVYSTTTWSYAYDAVVSVGFVQNYLAAFGSVPGPVEAAAYDGVFLLARAIGEPGSLIDNLADIDNFLGVQGELDPSTLATGELSNNVAITRLGEFGAPAPIVRYAGDERLTDTDVVVAPININPGVALPTATPQGPPPTPTLDGVFLTATRRQNIRTGPGLNYDVIGQFSEGETARIIGANLDFSWVVIQYRGQQAWLFRDILEVSGNLSDVPLVQPPPTPTPPPATATPTAQPIPDLVVSNAIPNRLIIGQPFNVTATVTNQGGAAAGPFAVAASFEPGGVYSAVNLQGLGAGQSINITLTGTLGTGATGQYTVAIVADLNDQVNEGPAGEANNTAYELVYTADRPTLSSGTITIAPGSVITLDTMPEDIQWTGNELIAVNGANIYVLSGNVAAFSNVHYDAINTTTNASPINVAVLPNALLGLKTDNNNNNRGVIRVDNVIAGGNLTITYRIYQ